MRARLLRTGPLPRLTMIAAALLMTLGVVTAVPTPASAAVTLCDVELEYGESGSCVERLQKRLNELGLNCGNQLAADGVFGEATHDRVLAFQGRNRLKLTGVVGSVTRAKLADPDEGLAVTCLSGVRDQIRAVFAAADEDDALIIARCESAYNPLAIGINTNGTMDIGVFQFNTGGTLQAYMPGSTLAAQIDSALHSDTNIHAAFELHRDDGDWGAWSCRDQLSNG